MGSKMAKLMILVLALGLVAAACSKSSSSGGGTTSPPTTEASPTETESGGGTIDINGETANDEGTASVSGQTSFELEADTDNGTNYFKPTVLTGTPGETITLELKNESSSVKHNFSIEDQSINEDLDPSATAEVSVTFPQSGTVTFFCEYHRASGMLGGLQAA